MHEANENAFAGPVDSGVEGVERLAALRRSGLMDSAPEPAFDRLTRLAARFLRAPTSLVTFVEKDRQFFKSSFGLSEPRALIRQSPLSHSFCEHVVASGRPFVVENSREHPVVRDYPSIGEFGIAAYLGVPLSTADGHVLGSLCVIDVVPRAWTEEDVETLRDLAGAVMAEVTLRESGELYRIVTEVAPQIVWVAQGDGGIVYCNHQWFDYTGLSMAETADDGWTAVVHPDDRERVVAAWSEAVRDLRRHQTEVRFRRASDGAYRWHLSHGLPVIDGAGRAVKWIGTAVDIDDRKQAEELVSAQREWLKVILESIGDAVIATDAQGVVTFMNAVAQELCGWNRDDAAGQPLAIVFRIINEMTREPAENPVEKVLRIGGVAGLANHTVLVARDGTERPIADSGAPIKNDDGTIVGIVLVFRDITDRKRGERIEALAAKQAALGAAIGVAFSRRESLASMLQASTDAIVRHLDAAFARVWTLDESEDVLVLQASSGQYTHLDGPHSRVPVGTFKIGLIARERRPHLTNDVTKDPRVSDQAWAARERITSFAGYPLVVDDRLVGVMALFGRRALEAEALDALASVADVVALGIVRKQAERDARRATEAANAANLAKDHFLAALSHELRTPLTPVLMAVSALAVNANLPESIREEIGMVRRNVEMESRLIDDLLDLTRITQGKMTLQFGVVDVHFKIRNALDICREDFRAKGLRLVLDLRSQDRHVRGDAGRLQQVFWNLLKNAVKFTPEEGAVSVLTESLDGILRVEVTDTGIGIEPEVLPKIFEAFEQGGGETTRRFGGLGLGLAIAKTIVDAHGGALTASSAGKGKGTTFRLELSTVESPVVARPRTDRAAEEGRQPSLRILLVDDHADTLRVLNRMLLGMGHQVTTASSVLSALDAASRGSFDLLVSDVGLSDGTGLELMERLRPLPGIALTGYGMEDDVRKTREAGFIAHMTKPIDTLQLEAAIARAAVIIAARSPRFPARRKTDPSSEGWTP